MTVAACTGTVCGLADVANRRIASAAALAAKICFRMKPLLIGAILFGGNGNG
jgi:hypothetical protein